MEGYFWFPEGQYTSSLPFIITCTGFEISVRGIDFSSRTHHFLLNDCLPGSWWEHFLYALKLRKVLSKAHWKWWESFKILCLWAQTKDSDVPPRLQPIDATLTLRLWNTRERMKIFLLLLHNEDLSENNDELQSSCTCEISKVILTGIFHIVLMQCCA